MKYLVLGTRFAAIAIIAVLAAFGSTATIAQTCPFDDGNSSLAVEGLVLTRYALGLTGAPLVANTGIADVDAPSVEATINCPSCGLNITGNASMTIADATIISRKLAGLKGAALTANLDLGTGTRNTSAAVQSFLLAGCGTGGVVPQSCALDQIIRWDGTAWVCSTALPKCYFGQVVAGSASGALQCILPAAVATTVDNTATVGFYSSIAVPSDGLPIVAYYDSTNQDLKVLKCGNFSCSSGNTITTIDSTGNVGLYPSIAVREVTGQIAVISYYDSTNGALKVATCNNIKCTSAATFPLDSGGDVGRYSSIAIPRGDGKPVISYRDTTNSTVKVAKCANSTCTGTTTITTIEATSAASTGTSIAVTESGIPRVSYIESTSDDMRIALCADAACTSVSSFSGFSSSATLDMASLAMRPQGIPAVSFYDSVNGDLRFTTCFNQVCDTGTITATPDTAGTVGLYSSMAIAADGRPVVAYYDSTNADLKVLKCGNTQCTTNNVITTIDAIGSVGTRPSLALPPDGAPIISYYDATNSALKIFKCANDACVAP